MKRTIEIYGAYIDSEIERTDPNDMTPNIFKESISDLEAGDELEIRMNSVGGNCTSGIAIANLIRGLNSKGVSTTCVIDGICCSIATLTAMACKELKMYPLSFLMIHNAWTCVQGDADTLRQEAKSLEAMTNAIMSFYHEKFNLTDEQLKEYMNQETWISGSQKDEFKLNATILEEEKEFKYAAKVIDTLKNNFTNKQIIERLNKMEDTIKNEETTEVTEEVKKEVIEEVKEELEEGTPMTEEEVKEEETKPSYEELEKKIEELNSELDSCKKKMDECNTDDDVEKRVSGMQSKMQNKINDLTKEFQDKLTKSEQELICFKDQITSLKDKVEETEKAKAELQAAVSALKDELTQKAQALATLNANVLTPNKEVNYKDLHGQEFFDWVKNNNIR